MSEFNMEEFNELMQGVNNADNIKAGSISSCTAQYGGVRKLAIVEEFISALTTFKLAENINDQEVIAGMPSLLFGEAAVWWAGVKDKVNNFDCFVQTIRAAFSPQKPAWRIYADIFEFKQQKREHTESFLRKKRALFAKLPKPLAESDQIDIIFGFLHTQIKDRVFRHRVVNFDDLIKYAREAEETLSWHIPVKTKKSAGAQVRCLHCRMKGHTADTCLKKKEMEAEAVQAAIASFQATSAKAGLACHGCNAPGFIRSSCPNCNTFSTKRLGSDIPIVNVEIFGVPGQACIDTGARTSVASTHLKNVLDFYGCSFSELSAEVALADGSRSVHKYLSAECKIEIGGKNCNIKFVSLPNSPHNRILLGSDFLEHAGIVLNMGQRYWYFESNPSVHFDFEKPWPLESNLLESINLEKKSVNTESTGASVEPLKRKAVEELSNIPVQRRREFE